MCLHTGVRFKDIYKRQAVRMNQRQPSRLPWDGHGRWGRRTARNHSEMQREQRITLHNVSGQDLSFDRPVYLSSHLDLPFALPLLLL